MKFLPLVFAALLLFAFNAKAQNTNDLSQAEVQGRQLAQQLCEILPTGNFTNTGFLDMHKGDGQRFEFPLKCETIVTGTNWFGIYKAVDTRLGAACLLGIVHNGTLPNLYNFFNPYLNGMPTLSLVDRLNFNISRGAPLSGAETTNSFAGSDFWICDLGLEFFHWPEQKIIKHETRRTRACVVLESINPHPTAGAYSRVDTWIDDETMGIVHAEAYDANGKLLKVFDPKSFKKVNGQYELQDMEIRNVQTGSRTWIKFDLSSGS